LVFYEVVKMTVKMSCMELMVLYISENVKKGISLTSLLKWSEYVEVLWNEREMLITECLVTRMVCSIYI